MIIVSEKRKVVGTLSTLVGRYSLLRLPGSYEISRLNMPLFVDVVDDEGFENQIIVHGDFIVIPAQVPTMIDVKRVLTESEVVPAEIVSDVTID